MKKSKLVFAALIAMVLSACGSAPVEVEKVVMSKSSLQITVGDSKKLNATVVPSDATDKTLTWTTSANTIATVDSTGMVEAIAEGSAVITATSVNGKSATCNVEVKTAGSDISVESVSLSPNTINVGKDSTITVTASIYPIDATDKAVTFQAVDESIVEVTQLEDTKEDKTLHLKATVKALKTGSTDVIVATNDGGKTAKCRVNVQEGDTENCVIKDPTTIYVKATFNDTYGTLITNAIAELKIEEPNLTVNYTKVSGNYDDLHKECMNGLSTGDYADIAVQYPDAVADFINAQVGLDMNKYMDNPDYGWTAEEKADVYEPYLKEGQNYTISGTYSLPVAKSTEAMYYDGGKLIGLNLSEIDSSINGGKPLSEEYLDNLTWDELFDHLCPALVTLNESLNDGEKLIDTKAHPDDWAVFGYDSDDNLFITLAEQYGYGYTSIDEYGNGHIDFNNEGMKNLIKKFNDAYNKHYFTSKGLLGGTTYVNTLSNEDGCLFSVGSTGGVSYQFSASNPKDIMVGHIPQAPGKDKKVINQGPSMAFLSHQKEGQLDENRAIGSWLFYKKFTSTKFATPWSMTTGYSPIKKSVSESDDWISYCDMSNTSPKTVGRLLARNAVYAGSVGDLLFTSPVFKGSSEARNQVGGLFTTLVGKTKAALTDEVINTTFKSAEDAAISAI